jgi:hypothetical protein
MSLVSLNRLAVTLCLATSLLAPMARAATFSSIATGDWNNGSTWNQLGAVPTSSDAVVIMDGHTVTVTTTSDVAQTVSFGVLALGASININPGAKLTVTNDLNVDADMLGSAGVDVGSGSVVVGGNINIIEGSTGGSAKLSIGSGGGASVTGNVTFNAPISAANAEIDFYGPGLLTIGGSMESDGTLTNYTTAPGSVVKYAGNTAQTAGDYSYQNLWIFNTNGGVTVTGSLNVDGTLHIDSTFLLVKTGIFGAGASSVLQMDAGTYLKLGDAFTVANVPMPTFGSYLLDSSSTIYYGSAANQTINPDPVYANLDVVFTGSAGSPVKSMTSDVAINGNLNIDQQLPGTVTLDTGTGVITIGGSLLGDGALSPGFIGEIRLAGNNNHTGTFTAGTSIFSYNGAAGFQNVRAASYNDLIITGAGTNASVVSAGGSAVTLTVQSGAFFDINNNFTVSGLLSNDGTINGTGETLNVSTSGSSISGSGDFFATVSCGTRAIVAAADLHFWGSFIIAGGGNTVTNNGTMTVDNNLDGADGGATFINASNATVGVGGNFMTVGTLSAAGGTNNTVRYEGLNQAVKATTYQHLVLTTPGITPGAKTLSVFPPLTVNGDLTISGAANVTAAASIDVAGDFTLAGTATFDASSFTHTFAGDWTISGGAFTPNNSNITFDGFAPQTIGASPFKTVWFDGTGAKTIAGNLDIDGDLAVLNAVAVSAGASNLNIAGSFSDGNNTFTIGSGIVTMDGAGAVAINDGNFNDLVIAKSGGGSILLGGTVNLTGDFSLQSGTFALGSDMLDVDGGIDADAGTTLFLNSGTLKVGGDLTTDGTVVPGTGILHIDGTAAVQNWSGSTAPTIHNLTISKISGSVNLTTDVTVNGFLNLDQGMVSTGTNKLALTNSSNMFRTSGFVNGEFDVTHSSPGAKLYPMGTNLFGYSPMTITIANPGQLTVTIVDTSHPANTGGGSDILDTYWKLAPGTITGNVDLTFVWPNGAVNGTEASYVLARYDGSAWATPGGTVTPATNTASITGVSSFTGDWTVAAPASVSSLFDLEITTDGAAIAGVSENITITAKDSIGNTLTSYTGDHTLTFAGATASPNGDIAQVYDKVGIPQNFGNNTVLNFTNGVASTTAVFYTDENVSFEASEPSVSFTGFQYLVDVDAAAASELLVSDVNGGNLLYANPPFYITITATDDFGNPSPVVANTTIDLSTTSCTGCTGTLGGTLSQLIASGDTTASFNDLTYDVAETNVTIDAAATAGDVLTGVTTFPLTFNAQAAGVIVTNTNDSGAGSLRDAIAQANSGACGTPCNITFDILPPGAHTFQLTTRIPAIQVPVVIDGETQDGFSGTPILVIDGTLFTGSTGFEFTGGGSTLRGFILNNLSGAAVQLDSDSNTVQNCWLGTDLSGNADAGNGTGISIAGNGNTVGGNVASARNVISGNITGIRIHDTASSNTIAGNYLGTNVSGTAAIPNAKGIWLNDDAISNTIGGLTAAEGNVISGNSGAGIDIASSVLVVGDATGGGIAAHGVGPGSSVTSTAIIGNYIGVAADGVTPLGNGIGVELGDAAVSNHVGMSGNGNVISGNGTAIEQTAVNAATNKVKSNLIGLAANGTTSVPNTAAAILISGGDSMEIGGTVAADANTIANNGGAGVSVEAGTAHTILGNSIPSYATIPIDLGGDGLDVVDAGDPDLGPNDRQNAPVLSAAALNGGNIDVTTSLSTTGVNSTRIEFFKASAAGAPLQFVGYTCIGGGNLSNAVINVANGSGLAGGNHIVATATSHGDGTCTSVLHGTSEVSNLVTITCPAVAVNITGATEMCAGSAPIVLDAGAGFASYSWSTGEITRTISVSPAGTTGYTVNVTDANGCPGTDSHTVTVNALPTPIITGQSTACDSAILTASGGFTSYLWSTTETTQNITVTSSGTYSVTVTDANGCQGTTSHNITITGTPASGITPSGATTFCQGGSVQLTSAPAPSYLWSTGETTQTITVTTGGSYSVTTTNGSCSANAGPVLVTVNPSPVINITGPASACDSALLSGPAGYASYAWSNGDTTQNTTVTSSGTYTLTVTDANGCQGSDTHAVTVTPSPTPLITGPTAACDSAVLDAGPAFASYLWSTGETTRTITVTSSGIYSVAVTDGSGCTGNDTHSITISSTLTPVISGPTTACDSALLDAGTGYTSYLWSTGETTQTITVTANGTYSVTVTGAGGCTGNDSHTVTVNPSPAAVITGPATACDSAILDAGTGFSAYLWSTGETTQSITVTTSDTYSVTVTGTGGCQASDTHAITVDTVAAPVIAGPNTACGSAILDAGSGYASYLWSTGETTQSITVTATGTYSVTVTGAGGCTKNDSHPVTIQNTPPPAISGPATACGGTVLDAGAGYTSYLWSTGETTQSITVTATGTYSVTVTGAGGCTAGDSHNVTVNSTPAPVISGPASACDSAVLDAGSGYASYLWSTGETTQTITVTASGTYSVTVTGTGGCTGNDSHAITINNTLTPVITGPASACDSAILDAGSGFTSYLWSTGETTQTITVTASDTYSVTVTGAGGCTGNDSHAITVGTTPAAVITGPASACDSAILDAGPGFASYLWSTGETTQSITVTTGGTYGVTVTNASGCQASDTHAITVDTVAAPVIAGPNTACGSAILDAGSGYASYLWSTGETTQTITVGASATYSVTVTGAGGCTASDSHAVTIENTPAPAITGPATACDSAVLDAGTGYSSYLWSTGETTQSITVTTTGTYNVTVTGPAGCTAGDSHNVTVNSTPAPVITGPASACGSAVLDAGAGYTSYFWSTGETTQTITVSTSGTYSVTVTGATGCPANDSHAVTISGALTPVITGPASACDSAVLDAGSGFSSYLWSTGETTQTITVSTSGTYSVTVTGAGGCTGSDSHAITINNTLTPVITGPTSACDSAVLDAGSGFSSYLWSTGETTQTITVTASGTYSVTVTGAGGCTGTDSHAITISNSLTPVITGPTSACDSAVLDAGSGFNSYLWSTGETTQTITVSASGTYSVTVTGAGGCTGSDSHAVTISNNLTPVITGPASACDSAVLDAGSGFNSYLWSTGETTQTITVTTSGTYSVTVTGAGGCTGSDSHGIAIGTPFTTSITSPATVTAGTLGHQASVPALTGAAYTWSITNGTITSGQHTSAITFKAGAAGTINLSVTVTLNGCSAGDSNSITVTPGAAAPPDVKIVKSGPSSVQAGAQFVYAIDVLNLGPDGIDEVRMTDTLPDGVVVTNVAQGPWSCTTGGGTIDCIGFLPGHTNRLITVIVNAPQQTGTITNTAIVQADIDDPTPANNTSSVTTEVTAAPVNCSTLAPSLVSPAANATVGSPVTFSWSAVPGAFEYELWLVTGGVPQLAGTTATTSLTRSLPSGTSSWYVVARFPGDCTPTVSAQRTFTVQESACGTFGAPQLNSPAAGSTVGGNVTFNWTPVPLAIGYRVWIEANGTAAQDVGVTNGAISLGAALPPGAIVAYVDALFSGCPPTRSAPVAFNVARPDPCAGRTAAQPVAPVNNSIVQSSDVLFSWTAAVGADAYRVFYSVNGGVPAALGETVETSLEANVPAGVIRWRVDALREGCGSIDSQEFQFTLPPRNDCSTAAPSLLSPANNSTTSGGTITFSWSAVPAASAYEVWLAIANGSPAVIGTTDGTSLTHVVPAGKLEWFVRALGDRCPSRDSAPFTFTFTPSDACAENQRPMTVSPLPEARVVSPVAFEWTASPGAVSYELFARRGNERTPQRLAIVNTNTATVDVPAGRIRWYVRANFNGCSPLDSAEEKLLVVQPPAACANLDAPEISAAGQVSSGVPFTIRWTDVAGATSYQLQLASNAKFTDAETFSTSKTRFDLTRTNDGTAPLNVYMRVRAIDSRCRPEPTITPYGPSSAIFILPSQGNEAAVPLDGGIVRYRIPLGSELAGQSFSVAEKEPWLTVTPVTGVVPPQGMFLDVAADTTGLPLGTSLGAIRITLDTPAAGTVRTNATTIVIPTVGVSKSTPVMPSSKSEPPPDALIIPAVAHANGINSQFQSDVRVTNSSARLMNYEVTFTPSGDGGLQAGRQTQFAIEPGNTIALDDVLKSWFGTGGESAVGTLEIRPVADLFASPVSSGAFSGLTDLVTFAASRTFNMTANGTFGQYIPAIPYANFIGRLDAFQRPTALSLQQISQTDHYRTNLGIVEASGEPVSMNISVFGDGGVKLLEFPLNLAGGQHTQLNGFLTANGINNLSDGRVEIAVTSPGGKVTAYASVLDNRTNDPLLVTPVTLTDTGSTKWVMPGVADVAGIGQWQTDMRVFNAGTTDVETTMSFISLAGGEPKTVNVTIPAGQVRQFDRTLPSLFGIANDAGAVHITTPSAARLVATGRTYNLASNGTYGQFISAVTPAEAAGIESRPLQLLQVEESPRFRSNLGLAEVTGHPVTIQLEFIPPDSKFTSVTELTLGPNEFRQLGSVLRSVGMADTFNTRITVRVLSGIGRVTAYASVIDQLTNDPTYVPAQ